MSIPALEAKWMMASPCWAWQTVPPVHLTAASPSWRRAGEPQMGQAAGIWKGSSLPSRSSFMTLMTSGIMSPALWITTASPSRTSFSLNMSSLWRDALLTVDPATLTGSKIATGVKAPVRPTWTSIRNTFVTACSAWNL